MINQNKIWRTEKMRPTTLACKKRISSNNPWDNLLFNNYPEIYSTETHSIPLVNIVENDNIYKISLSAPGIEKSDFQVRLDGDKLLISCKKAPQQDGHIYLRQEFQYGAFSRKFELPDNADKAKINATYKNGVLEIGIAKTKRSISANKQIKIN